MTFFTWNNVSCFVEAKDMVEDNKITRTNPLKVKFFFIYIWASLKTPLTLLFWRRGRG
jgi:hypothetical protein